MSSLLIRRARLVPITAYDVAPAGPVDVLVRDGVVTDVGPDLAQPDTAVPEHDADGRWLVPGLWDAHVHLGQWTLNAQRIDTSDAASPADVLAKVADWIEAAPDGPVVGYGHRPGAWTEQPTVAQLDALARDVPVVLIAGDAHHAWLNTTAQQRFGLPVREGMVAENEWFAIQDHVLELAGEDGTSPAAYRATLDHAASLGVVGLTDFEFGNSLYRWQERWADGCDRIRVRVALYPDDVDQALSVALRTGDPLVPGDDRLTMGPLKIISDGSLNTRTAWCHEPYAIPGPDGPTGAPNLSPEELTALLRTAHGAGLEVATHAIGDAAVGAALAAYAATGAQGSIEHAQLVERDHAATMAALGLRASMQPSHLLDDRHLSEEVWPGRTDRCFALRWIHDAGVPIRLGSDAPVAPLDPWLAIDAAVRRAAADDAPWHPEQALTRAEALAASVDGQPMVRPGSRGDLVLLDADPLREDVPSPPVALTAVAGRLIHTAG
ncbi:amidohydrolase family protein [Nocardioides panacisoli]|uniref:amidohydrolase n=1 Tax=Nocardioides panacisoli TaxID=627624 RepID=UPI001C62A922|nr:amidohydrolase family protein [Nocardioides panacisoli]QYJ02943.1 amidohydrolase family protein [Nocardioides panacisoli]